MRFPSNVDPASVRLQGDSWRLGYRRNEGPLRRRQPTAVHQVRAGLGRAPRGRDRRGRRPHGPALRPRALGDLLRGARARRARLPARRRTRATWRRCCPASPARSPPSSRTWVLVFGDTNSTLAGARAAARDAACRSRTSRPACAPATWSMPEERARVEVDGLADSLLCPDERSRADPRGGGRPGRDGGRRRRDGGRLLFAPDRARALEHPRTARPRAGGPTSSPRCTETRTCRAAPRTNPRRAAATSTRRRLPRPSADARGDRRHRAALGRVQVVEPLGYLDFVGARLAGARDRHRFRRRAEGGLLVRRPVRDDSPVDRVGRHGPRGANVLVDDDPDALAEQPSKHRPCRPTDLRSTETATQRSGSRARSQSRLSGR